MKRTYHSGFISLVFLFLLLSGCKKDVKQTAPEPQQEDLQARIWPKDGCRLVANNSEYGDYSFTYNNRGLLDKWYVWFYGGYFQHDYNFRGNIIRARLFVDEQVVTTIIFHYFLNRVVRETWYDAVTKEKTDEIFYTYTWNGLMKKAQSFMGDYYTVYKHTPEGNVSEWATFFGGKPLYKTSYTYLHKHKNPDRAIPGLEYSYPFINGGYSQNKWYSTSEKDLSYDEEGNEIVDVDQDPLKTIVEANDHDFVTVSDFFDDLTQEYVHFRFTYENCGSEEGKASPSTAFVPMTRTNNKPSIKFLKKGSAKSIAEQFNEYKKELKMRK